MPAQPVKRRLMREQNKHPNFIYVGAPKSGSTWLFEALREHPDVYVCPEKSKGIFEKGASGSIGDYVDRFSDALHESAIGEISHDTFLYPNAARRIRREFPEMRILVCLREPGEFAVSAIGWLLTHTNRFGNTPELVAESTRMTELLDYPARLRPFLTEFPRNQVNVLFFDQLQSDPALFVKNVFEFLGVDPDFEPSVISRVVNPAAPPGFRLITHGAFKLGVTLRKLGLGAFVERAKHNPIVKRILYSSKLSQADRETLDLIARKARAKSHANLQELQELLDAPLPRGWLGSGE